MNSTDEGRKLAAELANDAVKPDSNYEPCFDSKDFYGDGAAFPLRRALAHLATNHLALKAEHEKAVGDLREIDRQCAMPFWGAATLAQHITSITAKYCETDPTEVLISAVAARMQANPLAVTWHDALRSELAKRGVTE